MPELQSLQIRDWKEAEIYDISNILKPGTNNFEVITTQTKGLLLQGVVRMTNGKSILIRSDDTWRVSSGKENWRPAFNFADPPMGNWGNIVNPLQKNVFPFQVWYRQQLPPGATALIKPQIKGKYSMYVNGHPLISTDRNNITDISGILKVRGNELAIRVLVTDETCGLLNPVEVVCKKVNLPLNHWNSMGLDWYSGRAIYSRKIEIPSRYIEQGTKLMLNLGLVNYFAEIWINNKLVTFRPWPPYEADITSFLTAGENQISIVVSNLSANQATWNILDGNINDKPARWWHNGSISREKERLVSGLSGPVRIIPYTWESVEIKIK
jgi:hypothetical protein